MTYNEVAKKLASADNILILTHHRPDGDTLGSAAALCEGLRSHGKNTYILKNPDRMTQYGEYVDEFDAPEDFVPDFVVSVDIASRKLRPINGEDYINRVDLAIDHHVSHEQFAKDVCLISKYSSCGEVVLKILKAMGVEITKKIATALYVAVSTDTGCFRYGNTNPDTMYAAAELMSTGIDFGYINKKLFRTKSFSRLKLESLLIANAQLYDDDFIIASILTKEMMKESGANDDDTDDIASVIGQVDGPHVSITIKELSEQWNKISVRTWPDVNASLACQMLGGGGHSSAAGCTIKGTPEEARDAILNAVRAVIKNG